jgi:phage baseplate assembly protein W
MPIRQQWVQNPHFSIPFRFGGINGGAYMNEQDSGDDIVDCIKAIIAWPIGVRDDLPDFGIPDLPFQDTFDNVIDQVRNAVIQWEDRAAIDAEGEFSLTDEMLWNIMVSAGVTGGIGRSGDG